MTASAPATNKLRKYRSPCLLMLPSLSRPPLECCFGTSPIQAEKLRPVRKAFGSATLGTRAVARAGLARRNTHAVAIGRPFVVAIPGDIEQLFNSSAYDLGDDPELGKVSSDCI